MTLLRNGTPWRAEALPFVDDLGRHGQLVVVKIQYTVEESGQLKPKALDDIEPLVHKDLFEGDGPRAPLLRPADVMAPQSATNVLLLGHAYAPKPDGVRHFEPWLGVGPAVFPMRVHGPRRWQGRWLLTRALSLFTLRRFKRVSAGRVTKLPLLWKYAYGGMDDFRGQDEIWSANPAGVGYQVGNRKSTLRGLPLPAIEDPRQPIRHWRQRRLPQLPGAVSPHWAPRSSLGGTRDAHWQATTAPAMPENGTALFHNTAHPALQFSPHLTGGESIHADGFRADRELLAFELPAHRISAHSYHYGEFVQQALPLNTMILEPDERRLTLLYRGFVPHWHKGFDLRRIAVGSGEHPAPLQP